MAKRAAVWEASRPAHDSNAKSNFLLSVAPTRMKIRNSSFAQSKLRLQAITLVWRFAGCKRFILKFLCVKSMSGTFLTLRHIPKDRPLLLMTYFALQTRHTGANMKNLFNDHRMVMSVNDPSVTSRECLWPWTGSVTVLLQRPLCYACLSVNHLAHTERSPYSFLPGRLRIAPKPFDEGSHLSPKYFRPTEIEHGI